jgi:hypothetical protein
LIDTHWNRVADHQERLVSIPERPTNIKFWYKENKNEKENLLRLFKRGAGICPGVCFRATSSEVLFAGGR